MKSKRIVLLLLFPLFTLFSCDKLGVLGKDTNTKEDDSSKDDSSNDPTKEDDSSSDQKENPYTGSFVWPKNTPAFYNSKSEKLNKNLTGSALKTNLHNIIKISTAGASYNGLWDAYKTTDIRDDGTLWDMYSTIHYKVDDKRINASYKKEGDSVNREHTIPQSIFSEKAPMKSDVFHVVPTDGYVNNRRSNFPHAEVGKASFTSSNNTKIGSSITNGVSGSVCEPADEYKGDFARTYFYFVTCYQNKMSTFKTFATFTNNTYPSLSKWAITLYKKWSHDDPVSKKETDRNEACYKLQKNRNPFIDFPQLEDVIWQ